MFYLTQSEQIAQITIDRGSARNAVQIDAWGRLTELLSQVSQGNARVLILRSAMAGTFSAGADILDLAALKDDPALRHRFQQQMGAAVETLAALPIATIALIEGDCFGAAVALAMACDIRIAAPLARFAITPAKIGISYPPADVARLKQLVGPGQAAWLLLSAASIDAHRARMIGLVEEVCDLPGDAVMSLALTIKANAPASIQMLKQSLAGHPAASTSFQAAFGTPDFAQGAAAFRERRPPIFADRHPGPIDPNPQQFE